MNIFSHQPLAIVYWIIPLVLFDLAFRATAMWHAARNSQMYWFIALAAVNSVGILPIIYLVFFKHNKKNTLKKSST